MPRDGYPVFGGADDSHRAVQSDGGPAKEEGTGGGGGGEEGRVTSLIYTLQDSCKPPLSFLILSQGLLDPFSFG